MSKVHLVGQQQWMKSGEHWYVLMWGWWPGNDGTPRFRWVEVDDEKIPEQLKKPCAKSSGTCAE